MQQIEFGTLSFKNFRIHNEGQLDFPADQLIAITGRNGRGKSSFFMALQVALYGKTAEGIELSDLVNRRAGKDLEVGLTFTVTDEQKAVTSYEIHRYYQHKKYKNKLVLMKDGVDISQKTATETYKTIESILIPRNVFLNTVYFSQQVKDFFTALTDAKQKEIFEAILQLEEWEVYYKNASNMVKQKAVDIANLESQRDQIQARVPDREAEIKRMVVEYEAREKEHNTKADTLKSEIEILQDQISNLEGLTVNVDDLRAKLQKVVEDMATNSALAKGFQQKKDEFEEELSKREKLANREIELEFNKAVAEMKERLQAEAGEIKQKFDSKLPLLVESINKGKIELAKKEAEINQEFSDLNRRFDVATLQTERDNVLDKLSTQQETLKTQLGTLKDRHESLKQDRIKLKQVIESMSGDKVVCPTCSQEVKDDKHTKHLEEQKKIKQGEFKEKTDIATKVVEEFQKTKTLYENSVNGYKEKSSLYETKLKEMALKKQQAMDEFNEKNEQLTKDLVKKIEEDNNTHTELTESMETELQVFRDQFVNEQKKLAEKRSAKFSELNKTVAEQREVEMKEIKDKLSSTFNEVQKLDKEKRDLTSQITEAEDGFNELKAKKILLTEKKTQFDKLSEVQLDTSDIEAMTAELESLKDEGEKLERQIVSDNDELEVLQFWKKGFSDKGIPSMLIDEVVPFMNTTIKQELEKIAPGKYIVSFDTVSLTKGGDLREKFAVNILNVENGADSHKLLSGGEKRQIDVCCMRVLRLLAERLYQKSFNITLLDEVLDSLDSDNASIFCQHLKALSKGQNITLITHSMLQDAECDKVLGL